MKAKKSRLLEEGMEIVRGMYEAGVIDEDRLREYGALYSQTPQFDDVREIREKVKLRQSAFYKFDKYQRKACPRIGNRRQKARTSILQVA